MAARGVVDDLRSGDLVEIDGQLLSVLAGPWIHRVAPGEWVWHVPTNRGTYAAAFGSSVCDLEPVGGDRR